MCKYFVVRRNQVIEQLCKQLQLKMLQVPSIKNT